MYGIVNNMPRIKETLLNLTLLVCSILICLIFLELILWKTMDLPESCRLYERDDSLFFKNKANLNYVSKTKEYEAWYITNAEGLRENQSFGQGGVNRVLTIGDSFTFGVGLNKEDTFQEKWERKRNGEVINAGVVGYGTWQSMEFLRSNIKKYSPKTVVFSFYNNDVKDDTGNKYLTVDHGCLISINMSPVKKYLYRYSRVYLLYQSSKNYLMFGIKPIRNFLYAVRKVLYTFHLSKKATLMYPVLYAEEPPELKAAWNQSLANIREMNSICKKNSCNFILVYVPSRIQANEDYRNDYIVRNAIDMRELDLDKPSRILGDFSQKNNIRYIDLLDAFRERGINGSQPQIYWAFDLHFNEQGAQIVSEILYDEIDGKQ